MVKNTSVRYLGNVALSSLYVYFKLSILQKSPYMCVAQPARYSSADKRTLRCVERREACKLCSSVTFLINALSPWMSLITCCRKPLSIHHFINLCDKWVSLLWPYLLRITRAAGSFIRSGERSNSKSLWRDTARAEFHLVGTRQNQWSTRSTSRSGNGSGGYSFCSRFPFYVFAYFCIGLALVLTKLLLASLLNCHHVEMWPYLCTLERFVNVMHVLTFSALFRFSKWLIRPAESWRATCLRVCLKQCATLRFKWFQWLGRIRR